MEKRSRKAAHLLAFAEPTPGRRLLCFVRVPLSRVRVGSGDTIPAPVR